MIKRCLVYGQKAGGRDNANVIEALSKGEKTGLCHGARFKALEDSR